MKRLIILGLVVALVTVMSAPAALFAMGGGGNGGNGGCDKKHSSSKCEYKKRTICHKTGNGKFVKISVSKNAVPAHLKHGDKFPDKDGKCEPKKDNGKKHHGKKHHGKKHHGKKHHGKKHHGKKH